MSEMSFSNVMLFSDNIIDNSEVDFITSYFDTSKGMVYLIFRNMMSYPVDVNP